jgi:UMF1 family MFS transporter
MDGVKFNKKRIFSWAMFDFANTIYSMNVVSLYFPLIIIYNYGLKDIYVGVANSVSMLIVALTAPFLGQMTDRTGRRMPSLVISTIVCVLAVMGIGILSQKSLSPFSILALFVFANVGFQLGLVFYNALLPQIAPEGKLGLVSGIGTAFGYLGSIFGMILVMPFNEGNIFGLAIPFIHAGGRAATFLPSAILFLIFAIPTFLWVRENKCKPAKCEELTGNPLKKILDTLRDTKKYPGIRRFLIGKLFYDEGIETAIIFMGVYAEGAMGLPDSSKLAFFVIATTGAAVGSWIFGHLTDKWGSRKTMNIVLAGWIVSLILLIAINSRLLFFLVGIPIGALLGGIWTASRPLLLELSPPESVGRFFGLYSLSGKVAAIFGPLLWGAVVGILSSFGKTVSYRAGVFALAILILIGWIITRPLLKKGVVISNK